MKRTTIVLLAVGLLIIPLALATILYDIDIELYFTRSLYSQEDEIEFTGRLLRDNRPLAGKLVTVQISSPAEAVYVDQLQTNSGGYFHEVLAISPEWELGNYTLWVNYRGNIETETFQLAAGTRRINLSLDKAVYRPGDIVRINGSVTDEYLLVGEPVTIQVETPRSGMLFIDQLVTDEAGKFTTQFKLPSEAEEGLYPVYTASGSKAHTFFEVREAY